MCCCWNCCWKVIASTKGELDIIAEWADHSEAQDWHVGRWRQTIEARGGVQRIAEFKSKEKKPGVLLLVHDKWNLNFYKDSTVN